MTKSSTAVKTKSIVSKRWVIYRDGYGVMNRKFATRDAARDFKNARANYTIYDTLNGVFVR